MNGPRRAGAKVGGVPSDALRRAAELLRGGTLAQLALEHLAGLLDPVVLPAGARDELEPWLQEARARQRERSPLSATELERALSKAWGTPPARVLADLDPVAHASTPSSQVHRGRTRDGADVAVKVLRPGLADAVRSELGLLDTAALLAAPALPGLDPTAFAAELRERLLDELDLAYEADTQRSFARAVRREPALHVPAVDTELSAEAVLVSDWVEGRRLRELSEPGERAAAAGALLRFHLGVAATVGTVHADPHPDNALLLADGRLAIVDFGASRRVGRERFRAGARALAAAESGDAAALSQAAEELGWEIDAVRALDRLSPVLGGPVTLDAVLLRELAGGAAGLHPQRVAPGDLWPLRMLGTLALTLAGLGVEADWPALARAALDLP